MVRNMIDSNKTLEYENGETSGYFKWWGQGYEDGVIEFAKYLKENSFLCDSNDSFSFQAINVEDDLDDMVKDFLESFHNFTI